MGKEWLFRVSGLLLALLLIAACGLVAEEDGDPGGPTDPGEDPNNGTIIIEMQTVPAGQAGAFTVTGVPTGTLTVDSSLAVSDLEPGTYTTTEVDPAPDFDVTAVECDDGASASPSSGDASSRTAVINLESGETVRCTFTNTQRGSLVVAMETEPPAAAGSFRVTGVPSGTLPSNGTLVVANLTPGTYSSTEVDPAPDFDLTAVECDDGGSPSVSSGDASTRTAIFNLDPGEMVTCTFVNTRRATAVVAAETEPDGASGSLLFTGVPTGTIPANGTLVAANLTPGTYTTTESDPAPEFELIEVTCDDGASATASSGDASSRTAVFNLDPGETVTCLFTNEVVTDTLEPGESAGGGAGGSGGTSDNGEGGPTGGLNPFEDPDEHLPNFPLPDEDELPEDAGSATVPRAGPWTAFNLAGQMDCGGNALAIPASAPEGGVLEVLDEGRTVVGTGLADDQTAPITMTADPAIAGRYAGDLQATQEGVPIVIDYFWQVVTEEYIVGYLTSTFTSEGVSCTIYRPYELRYNG